MPRAAEVIHWRGMDLDEVCPECEGDGWISNPLWNEWWSRNEELPPPDHALRREPEELPCGGCQGRGTRPTPDGRDLLRFLKRYH